jgi:hypothetical protein
LILQSQPPVLVAVDGLGAETGCGESTMVAACVHAHSQDAGRPGHTLSTLDFFRLIDLEVRGASAAGHPEARVVRQRPIR